MLFLKAEYVYNQLEFSEESKAALHHLKLDLVSSFNFTWRVVHYNILMRHSIALDNITRTIPPIDENQKVALHASFMATTLSEVNWQNYKKPNIVHASALTVFPAPAELPSAYAQ